MISPGCWSSDIIFMVSPGIHFWTRTRQRQAVAAPTRARTPSGLGPEYRFFYCVVFIFIHQDWVLRSFFYCVVFLLLWVRPVFFLFPHTHFQIAQELQKPAFTSYCLSCPVWLCRSLWISIMSDVSGGYGEFLEVMVKLLGLLRLLRFLGIMLKFLEVIHYTARCV